jgi:hypothetical protein
MSRETLKRIAALILLTVSTSAAASSGYDAFDSSFLVFNDGALARGFVLPEIGQGDLLTDGQWQERVQLDWTNEYVYKDTGGETLTEDGETQRYGLWLQRGLPHGFQVGVQLPVMVIGGGVLDGPIESWHHFFGLPNGGREYAPKNRVLYQYVRNGQTLLDDTQSTVGLGDVRVYGAWQAKPGLAVHLMGMLPTGSRSNLTGGASGLATWVDYAPHVDPASDWFGFLSAGGSYTVSGAILPAISRHFVGLAGGGAGYHITSRFSLLGQLYAHTPLYRQTAEPALHRMGLQLALGGRYALSHHTALEAGFQEDAVVDSSPDFSIHLALTLL